MIRLPFIFLTLFFHLYASVPLTKSETLWIQKHSHIRVSHVDNWPPFDFSIGSQPAGYSVDLLNLLASRVGLKLEYVKGLSWEEQLEHFKQKKIDLLHSLARNQEREKFGIYSKPITSYNQFYILRKNTPDINSIHELSGKRIASVPGWNQFSLLKSFEPAVTVVPMKSTEETFSAVSKGQADAAVSNNMMAWYIWNKKGIHDLKISGDFELQHTTKNNDLHYMAQKNAPELISILNKAYESLAPKDVEALNQKWFGSIETYSNNNIPLSDTEKAWLKKHPVLRVSNEMDYPPFDFAIELEPRGYSIDLLNILAKRIGLKVEYFNGYTWKELVTKFKEGKLDLLHSLNSTPKRKEFGIFSRSYSTSQSHFIVRRDHEEILNIKELYGKTVAVGKGWSVEEYLKTNHPLVNLISYTNIQEIMHAVSIGEADAMINDEVTVRYMFRSLGLRNLKISGWFKEFDQGRSMTYHFLAQKDSPELISMLNKALDSLTAGELQKLDQKWFGEMVEKEPIKRVLLTKEEQAFLDQNPRIKVTNELDWPPFDFAVGGKPTGYSVELLDLIATRIGIELEYINGYTWAELWKMFENKKVDVAHPVYYSDYRNDFGIYTKPLYVGQSIFVKHRKGSDINKIEDLIGKVVAMPKSWATTRFLKDHYPDVPLLITKNMQEAVLAVSTGKATATIELDAVMSYLLKKEMRHDLEIAGWFKEYDEYQGNNLHYIIRHDWPLLHQMFTKAMESVTPKEMDKLQQKWFGITKRESEAGKVHLTPKEEAYLMLEREIPYCIDPTWMPMEYLDEDGNHQGLTRDYLDLIVARTGMKVTLIQTKSWKETLHALQSGQCKMILDMTATEERKKYLKFTEPYLDTPQVVAMRLNAPYVASAKDLYSYKIGVVAGYAIRELLNKSHPNLVLHEVENVQQGIQMVSEGTLDGFIDFLPSISFAISHSELVNLKIAGQIQERYILAGATLLKEPVLHSILNKSLQSFTKDEHKNILHKWMSVKYEQGFEYDLLWKISAGVALVILILLYRQRQVLKRNRFILEHNRQITEINNQLEQTNTTLGQTNQELEQTIVKLKKTQDKLVESEKMASLGRLVSGVAHELNTPLGICVTTTSMIKEKIGNTDKQFIEGTLKKSDMEKLIKHSKQSIVLLENNLRRSSELVQGFKQLAMEEHDEILQQKSLYALIQDVQIRHHVDLEESEVTCQIDVPEMLLISTYASIMQNVLGHLISNVIDHAFHDTHRDRTLLIEGREHQDEIVLSIEDNGIGLDKKMIKEIFQPFYTTARIKGKAGLGLSIVYNLVTQKLKGSIVCESVLGQGTKYILTFPHCL
jgi:ABC-type amino acid transport substrate-binding protein